MTEDTYLKLLAEALSRAYAPYSMFAVGAVVRGESGRLHSCATVDNAAFPPCCCSETSALAAMVLAGDTRLTEVAVMAEGDRVCTPCGGCRQKLKEFALPGTQVLCYSPDELRATFSLEALLPHGFGPEYLS